MEQQGAQPDQQQQQQQQQARPDAKPKPKPTSSKITGSQRAGLVFPVGRVSRMIRQTRLAPRISSTAGVYVSAVMEYLAAEIVELAGYAAKDQTRKRISPRHIELAVRKDGELDNLLSRVTVPEGGVVAMNPVHKVKNSKAQKKNKTYAGPK